MIILHNIHSKESRDFVAAHGDGNTVIDWYNDRDKVDKFLQKYSPPSGFPTMVDEVSGIVFRTVDVPSFDTKVFTIRRFQRYEYLITHAKHAKENGIIFDAVGTAYHYPTGPKDQIVLNTLVTATTIYADTKVYSLWVSNDPDSKHAWRHMVHTAAQVRAVGEAVMDNILTQNDKFEALLIQLTNATTLEHLAAIIWED